MFCRIASAVTGAISCLHVSPEKHSAYLFFAEHTFNFLGSEEGKKSGEYQNTLSHQFIPTFARDFLNLFRNTLVVKQGADNVLQHRKHPQEYAEDDRAIDGGHDHYFEIVDADAAREYWSVTPLRDD
jgi:hypothetical protein